MALGVPRPERGYWAKLAAGRAPSAQPLPPPKAGDLLEWSKGTVLPPPSLARGPAPEPTRRSNSERRVTGTHPLIGGTKHHLENGRPVGENAYLKPFKYLLVDITTSRAALERGLGLANDLFNALESAGYPVTLAPPGHRWGRGAIDPREVQTPRQNAYYPSLWSPSRPTVVYVGEDLVGLSLVELSESVLLRHVNGKYVHEADYIPPKRSRYYMDHSWTTTQEIPNGRFRLIAYAPHANVTWSTHWDEKKGESLRARFPIIVKAMKGIAEEAAERHREAERQWEIKLAVMREADRRRDREQDKRQVSQSIKDSRAQLDEIIDAWGDVRNLELFFEGVEAASRALSDQEREQVLLRLAMARSFVGTQNPMDFFLGWKSPRERYTPRYDRDGEEIPQVSEAE